MPSLRDWRDALFFLLVFFTVLGLCDPAPAAEWSGAAFNHQERTMMDRYYTEDEQGRLLKVLKVAAAQDALGRRDDAMVRMLIHSGLRIGEFTLVTIGDALAALRESYLFIPKEHRKGHSKGVAKDHAVFVTAPLRRAIEDMLKARDELAGPNSHVEDRLVVGRHGEGVTVRALQLRYKEHARSAGLARSSPHWLRHTRAMNIMRRTTSRDPRGVVQRALGQSSISSTGVYTGTPREEMERALIETDGRGRATPARLRKAYEGRASA